MQDISSDAWSLFLSEIKSPLTREKYIGRLSKFFYYLDLQGATMEEKARVFAEKGKGLAFRISDSTMQVVERLYPAPS